MTLSWPALRGTVNGLASKIHVNTQREREQEKMHWKKIMTGTSHYALLQFLCFDEVDRKSQCSFLLFRNRWIARISSCYKTMDHIGKFN